MRSRFLVILLILSQALLAQIVNPIKWTWKAEPIKEGEYKLVFTAKMDKEWHTYSMYQGDAGARPTAFNFTKNADIELVGKMTESSPKTHEGVDDAFGVVQKSFAEVATFTQVVKVKNKATLKGNFEYMVCNNATCLPPDTKEFSFDLEKKSEGTKSTKDTLKTTDLNAKKNAHDTLALAETKVVERLVDTLLKEDSLLKKGGYYANFFDKGKFGKPLSDCGNTEEPMTLLLAILLGLGGGLFALFTPCVFPMIPLTVSFFTKRNENKSKGKFESIFYGFCIVLVFFLLSMPFLVTNISPNILNEISTNLWVNLAFFVVFIIFAFSFFGYYEISLPTTFANKADSASNTGGLLGIFFMALTLVIVSFSCTGPLLGTLLAGIANGSGSKLNFVAGMTSFGFALGLPFTLFAFFPDLLKKMPRSGSWMDSLKVVLGFLELILALKFLSNADLAGHWGLVKRELFLAIWAILGFGIVLYLMGIIKFKDAAPINRMHPIRLGVSILAFVFAVYCVWGVLGKSLSAFSGFIPPDYYSYYKKQHDCPNDLPCYHDYDEALAVAKRENKPLFIDFTGYNCANCRLMEERIWSHPEIYNTLREKFVIVSLYVDDYQKKLPDSLQYVSPFTGSKRDSYGHKWSDFQAICFETNTQPQYVLVTPDEKLLNNSWKGFDPEHKKFKDFLKCALSVWGK